MKDIKKLINKKFAVGVFIYSIAVVFGLLCKFGVFERMDLSLTRFIQSHQGEFFIRLCMGISLFEYITYLSIALLVVISLSKKTNDWKFFIFISIFCLITISGFKNIFRIERPYGENITSYYEEVLLIHFPSTYGFGYPSGHVVVYTFLLPFVYFIISKRIQNRYLKNFILFTILFLIATVGIARISLGAHFLSQVIGGYLFGIGALIISNQLSVFSNQ